MPDAHVRAALRELAAGRDLPRATMTAVLREIMAGDAHPGQLGALLMGLAAKGETSEEIAGAAVAMREAMTPVSAEASELVDTCGTGGSGVARRNVSTAVAIVLAACGVKVAKHGNRAASSRSGSADVLEALGVGIAASADTVSACIDGVGVGFLFAAALHPAMKHAMPVRKALGVRTLFNLLGPLTNPAGAKRQLLGVFDPRRCMPLASALSALGSTRVMVVHGFRCGVRAAEDAPWGIDDLSPEGESLVAHGHHGVVKRWVLTPEQAGVERFAWEEIAGGDPADNAEALKAVLHGAPGRYRDAVVYSGAAGLLVAGEQGVAALPELADRIAAALDDGSAAATLAALVKASNPA
ncbi:MAG: anthranilate phosphoribosyltransferase [Nannocystales bacterium]